MTKKKFGFSHQWKIRTNNFGNNRNTWQEMRMKKKPFVCESKINQPCKRHNESIFSCFFFFFPFRTTSFISFCCRCLLNWTIYISKWNKLLLYDTIHYIGRRNECEKRKKITRKIFWSFELENWHSIESHAWRDAISSLFGGVLTRSKIEAIQWLPTFFFSSSLSNSMPSIRFQFSFSHKCERKENFGIIISHTCNWKWYIKVPDTLL